MKSSANPGVPDGVPFGPIPLELFLALMVFLAAFFWVYYRHKAKQAKTIRQKFLDVYVDAELRRHCANVSVIYEVVGRSGIDLRVIPVWNQKPIGSGSTEYTFSEEQLLPFDREAFLKG